VVITGGLQFGFHGWYRFEKNFQSQTIKSHQITSKLAIINLQILQNS